MVQINAMAAQEHVGEIEHGIQTIKERSRSVIYEQVVIKSLSESWI